MEDRKLIRREHHFNIEDCDGFTIDQVISYFQDIQSETFKKGEADFKVYYYKTYECDIDCYFEGESIETDIEYNERIAAEKANKIYNESFAKRQEEKELAEYKRLKAKYGE